MRHLRFLIVGLLVVAGQTVLGQCCAAGNPNCDNNLTNGSERGMLDLTLAYQYSFSDTYFDGAEPSDFKYMNNSFFKYTSLRAGYGLTDKLKLTADMGYFISKAQTFETGFFREAVGLGDLSISGTYQVYKNSTFSITPLMRVTLPIGAFDQKYGPVILPIDLQPSAGSFRIAAGGFTVIRLSERFGLSALATYELSAPIETEHTNYRYGGLTNTRIMANYRLDQGFNFGLHAWLQSRERAVDHNEMKINATGGQVLFLCPDVSYQYKQWRINTRYERPVYKNMNGLQLTNKHRFAVSLTKVFDLNREVVWEEVVQVDSMEIMVNGICGMCKNRIELIAINTPQVVTADWDLESKILKVGVGATFSSEELIERLLEAGHDVEDRVATDKAYDTLHGCCKYRDSDAH